MIAIALVVLVTPIIGVPVEDYQLKFVTFVHRHGDRSPVETYPNDPYGNVSIWNNGWGELTNAGKQNSYKLGKWLRNRYYNFLPKIYSNDDYEVQSTDVSRTLMSASLVLAGLYEPTESDIWNPDIKWQPIPVHTTPKSLDNVLATSKQCLRHSQLMAELAASKEFRDQVNPLILNEAIQFAGYNKSASDYEKFLQIVMVYDALFVQKSNGMKLPEWTAQYYPKLKDMSLLYLRSPSYNKQLQRLYCGNLVNNILQNFKNKSSGTLKKKMWQYSAHDITIVGLMQCLGFKEMDTPPYASAFILELRSKEKEDYVRILYKAGEELTTMVMPGCVEYCPLKKFEELVKPIIPVDWEAECKPVK